MDGVASAGELHRWFELPAKASVSAAGSAGDAAQAARCVFRDGGEAASVRLVPLICPCARPIRRLARNR